MATCQGHLCFLDSVPPIIFNIRFFRNGSPHRFWRRRRRDTRRARSSLWYWYLFISLKCHSGTLCSHRRPARQASPPKATSSQFNVKLHADFKIYKNLFHCSEITIERRYTRKLIFKFYFFLFAHWSVFVLFS
jgi:hypothetical protein